MKLLSGFLLTAFLLVLVPMSANACPDKDKDGVCNSDDPCPLDNPDDTDTDGVCDSDDPCPLDNPDDANSDGVCDTPAPAGDCSSLGSGVLKGLCNAYCNATDCDGEPKASERACNKLLANYIRASDGELPPCVGQPEPPQQPELCSETCSSFSDDGDCDDGGPGADYRFCELGTDCKECGVRCPVGLVPDVNNSGFCTFP